MKNIFSLTITFVFCLLAHPASAQQTRSGLLAWASKPDAPVVSMLQTPTTGTPASGAASQVAGSVSFTGQVVTPDGKPIEGASVELDGKKATTDRQGRFQFSVPGGDYKVAVVADNYGALTLTVVLRADTDLRIQVEPSTVVTIRPEPDAFTPDPATRILVRENVLDANPGRPGVPISVPGFPAETASGGVKAPQYFAPGVNGDHGEPIAQYYQIGDFLYPNNLPANAHGNGYADPNPLIPAVIGSVQTDGAAYNVRHGNNAINLAVTFGLRQRFDPFIQFTGDRHDADVVLGYSAKNPATRGWVALQFSVGNGFLDRPEQRQQYKINTYRAFTFGRHELTLFGVGYYGYSRLPGLVPIDVRTPGDTIDSRQQDLTHSTLLAASDTWRVTNAQQLQFSGFVRTYSLRIVSNFGDGLIRQRERRNVEGGNVTYLNTLSPAFSVLAGLDVRRDAPRGLNLGRADDAGVFQPVTGNDFTFIFTAPFVSIDGTLNRFLRYNVGLRRDEVSFDNRDTLNSFNSYHTREGLTTPKGTLTFTPPEGKPLPSVALSYGQAFHINDPRISLGGQRGGSLIARSRAYQLVATQVVKQTEFRVTLAHVTNSNELAKIDSDTGLQEDVGPSLVRSVTVAARRDFNFGSLQASLARANSISRDTNEPLPEAPRLIFDVLGTIDRLPLDLHAKVEFERVGRKPLGDGFHTVPVSELRGSLFRGFADGRIDAGVNFFIARGFTGQTLEVLQLPGEPEAFERPVGVRLKSYASVTVTYRFRRGH